MGPLLLVAGFFSFARDTIPKIRLQAAWLLGFGFISRAPTKVKSLGQKPGIFCFWPQCRDGYVATYPSELELGPGGPRGLRGLRGSSSLLEPDQRFCRLVFPRPSAAASASTRTGRRRPGKPKLSQRPRAAWARRSRRRGCPQTAGSPGCGLGVCLPRLRGAFWCCSGRPSRPPAWGWR